jgi:NAD(P)-dependent dehydrogenase (short-subunit alcohol dehydrogenase family)
LAPALKRQTSTGPSSALLVGAGDAIGAAVTRRFAAGGYTVCIARRDAEKSRSVVQQIIVSGGIAHAVSTDVRSEEAVQALFAQVEAELRSVWGVAALFLLVIGAVGALALSILDKARKSGSQLTHRWREPDSNLRSPVKKNPLVDMVLFDPSSTSLPRGA